MALTQKALLDSVPKQLLIGGTWRDSGDGTTLAVEDPSSDLGPGPRLKIREAADYLDVAPTVVAVARDLDLARDHLALPQAPADPHRLAVLVEEWGLATPVARLTGVLAALGAQDA